MAPPDDKKSPGGKAPAKVETTNLKVFIHCEGCKKKVKKILCQIEGVENVDIDASLGRVTVTGNVDSKVLLKKLEKKGKVAEVINASGSGGSKGKEQQKDQSKGENKEPKKVRFEEAEGDKKSKGGGGGGASANSEGGKKGNSSGDNKGASGSNGAAHTLENEKKKKGGDVVFDEVGPSKNTAHKNVTPMMVETGYSVESADYATHIFSDENTDSCRIM